MDLEDFDLPGDVIVKLVDLTEKAFMSGRSDEIIYILQQHFSQTKEKTTKPTVKQIVNAMDSCFTAYTDFSNKFCEPCLVDRFLRLKIDITYRQALYISFFKVVHCTYLVVHNIPPDAKGLADEAAQLASDFIKDSRQCLKKEYQQHINDFFKEFDGVGLLAYNINDYIFLLQPVLNNNAGLVSVIINLVFPRFYTELQCYLDLNFKEGIFFNIHNRLCVEKCLCLSLEQFVTERVEKSRKSMDWYFNKSYNVKFDYFHNLPTVTFKHFKFDFKEAERILLGEKYAKLFDRVPSVIDECKHKKMDSIQCFSKLHNTITNSVLEIYLKTDDPSVETLSKRARLKKVAVVSLSLTRIIDQRLIRYAYNSLI